MPTVIVITYGFTMKSTVARAMLIGGGGLFSVLMGLAVIGMLLCDGKVFDGYSACLGGDAVDRVFAALSVVLEPAAYVYVLAGPLLAGLAYLIEWLSTRGERPA